MLWDLGCFRMGAVWVLQGAIWGHRRLPVAQESAPGFAPRSGRRGLRERRPPRTERTGRRTLGTFVSAVDGPGGATSTILCRRGAAGSSISTDRRSSCRGLPWKHWRRRSGAARSCFGATRCGAWTAGRAVVSVARDGEHSGRARRSRQLARSDPGSVTMRRSKQS